MATRRERRSVSGSQQIDGAGVHLVRVVGHNDVTDFDPFLLLDAFDSKNPSDYVKGFPWHPHRGIETVTYLINGKIKHEDSLGNKGVIGEGECQWMTAGSGILHQEMPQISDHMLGFQLWINLPRKDKMTVPRYFDIRHDMVTTVLEEKAIVKVLSGEYKGKLGAKGEHVDATLLDIHVIPNESFWMKTNQEDNLFVYIIDGYGQFGAMTERTIPSHTAVLFNHDEDFFVHAGEKGIRFALFAGKPLHEPIAWGGPIVMNTQEELIQAFDELEKNEFIK